MLDGRVVLVTGGTSGLGQEIAGALAEAGATVAAVDGGYATRAAADAVFAAHAPLDAVVHARVDHRALVAKLLADTEPSDWDARSEALLRDALFTFQAAFGALSHGGGRVVLVAPTVAITGAAELVPYTTAVEGMRALTKSAARQWGRLGITVNCVAVPLELMAPDAPAPTAFVAEPAIGRLPDARRDVAAAVGLLVGPDAAGVTGTTIVVDGGTVMAP